jgi:hypothetical protein
MFENQKKNDMVRKYELVPYGSGKDELCRIILVPGEEIFLGRNEVTLKMLNGPNAPYLSRRHVSIMTGEDSVNLTVLSRNNEMVSVNGSLMKCGDTCQLQPMDKCTLFTKASYYHFILKPLESIDDNISENPNSQPSSKRQKLMNDLTPSINHQSVDQVAPSKESHEALSAALLSITDCSICLLPMALAHTIVPCGHNFCFVCLNDWMEKHSLCPICQLGIDAVTPSHMTSNIISEILKSSPEDFKDWQERESDGIARKRRDAESLKKKQYDKPTTKPYVPQPATTSSTTITSISSPAVNSRTKVSSKKIVEKKPSTIFLSEGNAESKKLVKPKDDIISLLLPEQPQSKKCAPLFIDLTTDVRSSTVECIKPAVESVSAPVLNSTLHTPKYTACYASHENTMNKCLQCFEDIHFGSFVIVKVGESSTLMHVLCIKAFNIMSKTTAQQSISSPRSFPLKSSIQLNDITFSDAIRSADKELLRQQIDRTV